MSSFLADLFQSIFTPGPTPTLIVATNATFGALQGLLGLLLVATKSIHFVILSVLCAGLWWAINWFATELQASKATYEQTARQSAGSSRPEDDGESGDDTETEGQLRQKVRLSEKQEPSYPVQDPMDVLRRRKSVGDSAGELSTEDEWEKVSEGAVKDR